MGYGTVFSNLASAALEMWANEPGRGSQRRIRQTGTCALLSGLGLGAGLMYFLDGENGKRRRQAVIDTLESWARSSKSAALAASRDARERLEEVAPEAKGNGGAVAGPSEAWQGL